MEHPATSLSPYITVKGAEDAITFYTAAFGASLSYKLVDPLDGRIGHSEIKIGDTTIMISDEYADYGALGPETIGGTPVKLHLYVDDVDAVFAKAVSLGATELRAVEMQFYGDKTGALVDPFGHSWMISTKIEDVSASEMQKRWNEMVSA